MRGGPTERVGAAIPAASARRVPLLRTLLAFVVAVALVAPTSLAAAAASRSPLAARSSEVAGGAVVLARFASPSARDAALALLGGAAMRPVGATGFDRIAVPGSADAAVAALLSMPGVLAAEADGRVHASFTPNDPYYPTDPITGLGEWGLRKARVNAAWDVERGNPSLTIATVDTGIDLTHPDLVNAVVPGTRILTSQDASCPAGTTELDDNGHGTHVAGIAAASGNDGVGIAGTAFGVHVMAIKALDCTGAGNISDAAEGITYAADHGARVVSMSFGSDQASAVLQSAIDYAIGKGVVPIAAAGNCGQTSPSCPVANVFEYPAADQGVLAVAATDTSDSHASFSTANSSVGIAAPGVNIISDFPNYPVTLGFSPQGYAALSGTSMATPLVSGVVALLLLQHPELTPAKAIARLKATADLVGGATGYTTQYGNGRVDADRALTDVWPTATATPSPTAVATSMPTPAPPAPTVAPTTVPTFAPAPTPAPTPEPLTLPAGGASAFCAPGRPDTATGGAFLPNVTKTLGGADGWQTPFIVQDPGSVATDLEVSFYDFAAGQCIERRVVPGLQPGRSFAFSPDSDPSLPGNTQYSVVVRSFGAPVVAVVDEHEGVTTSTPEAMAYDGFSSGATTMYLPNVMRSSLGFRTPIIIQDLGADPTMVTARFIPADGGPAVAIVRSMLAGTSAVIEPDSEPTLRDGVRYAVTFTSPVPIAVVENVHNVTVPEAFSVDGTATGAGTLYVPFSTKSTAGGRVTTIVVQNLGAAAATPTLTFSPLAGAAGAVQTFTAPPIAAGASWAFDPRYVLGTNVLCEGASAGCLEDGDGSFVIRASGATLAAVVNVVEPGRSMGYSAVATPAAGADLPNVTRTLGGATGWTGNVYLQSAGAQSATLSWYRFSDGSLAATQNVDLSAGMVRLDPTTVSGLSDDTQYAVVAAGVGGTIAAVATEIAAGGANAMSYNAFPSP